MSVWRRSLPNTRSAIQAVWLGIVLTGYPCMVSAEPCLLSPQHAGVNFPVEKVDRQWACTLQAIVSNYTTATKIGPLRAALSESMYRYLLDRPPLAAGLINRLDLGLYKAERRGPGRFWGTDGEGTEGLVELVYEDPTSRIYYLEGTHQSRLLPNMTGKAVLFLRMNAVMEPNGFEAMDSTMVSYVKLDNPILSGLVALLRSLIGGTVSRKLSQGVAVVNRLGLEMRAHPERVLFEAKDPPAFPEDAVAFLTESLSSLPQARPSGQAGSATP